MQEKIKEKMWGKFLNLKSLLRGIIQVYRYGLSPCLPKSCRFEPTCSTYAHKALEIHGLGRALILIAKRLGRCHPWGDSGWDPVPELFPEPSQGCSHASSPNLSSDRNFPCD